MKSVSEFCKTYLSVSSTRKANQKPETVLSRRSHRGLMVHLVTPINDSEAYCVGKMNFVDLAGIGQFYFLGPKLWTLHCHLHLNFL